MTDDEAMKIIHPPQTEAEAKARLKAQREFGEELRESLEAQKRLTPALEAYERTEESDDG